MKLGGMMLCAALGSLAGGAMAQTTAQLQYACKGFIEQQLNDPRDAQLEWTKGAVSLNKQGLHVVRFRGRAKNQYGALMLATFECTMRYRAPDDFTAVNLRVF